MTLQLKPYVDLYGFKYYVRIQDHWRFTKPFEPLTNKFLARNATESDVFLGIGARRLEPEPENYSFLYRNIHMNVMARFRNNGNILHITKT